MSRPNRKLAAIVFTDIVGFTELSGKNEPAALKLLEKQREIIKPIVDKYNGEWLKEIGDGLLLAFETIHDAVECSITIQGSTKAISDLDLRIGIHQGEVVYQNDDVVEKKVLNLNELQKIKISKIRTTNQIIERGLIEKIFGGVGTQKVPNSN